MERCRRPLNMYSLMTSIADVYDAVTTMRPYRAPLPPHTAISVMREEYAGRLEPRLLERFIAMLAPPGGRFCSSRTTDSQSLLGRTLKHRIIPLHVLSTWRAASPWCPKKRLHCSR